LGIAAQWWLGVAIPSLWWPGVLVVGFGLSAWGRRRWPRTATWQPRTSDHLEGGRVAMAMGLVGIVCGVLLLLDPRWILDFFWDGHAAPVAYQALTYSDNFLRYQAPLLLGLLLLNIPLYLVVMVRGRWSKRLRQLENILNVAICAAMAWTILDGPIFMAANSDQMAKVLMAVIVVFMVVYAAAKMHRGVRPAPN